MNDIEKAARLMGDERDGDYGYWLGPIGTTTEQIESGEYPICVFNPRKNKADLVDVETELGISVNLHGTTVVAFKSKDLIDSVILWKDHPTKFAARAEAVLSVVSQLYDAKYGKDGE